MLTRDAPDAVPANAITIDAAGTDLLEEIANIADNTDDIKAAVRRVEASLEVVLAMCANIQNTTHNPQDTNTAPPASWVGTP